MLLDGVSIVIPTFFRPGYLQRAVAGALEWMPECETIVACDDDGYTKPIGDVWIPLPFDRGLTAKRNAAVSRVTTEYTLIGSDDFNFNERAAFGVLKMKQFLDAHSAVDVVVGTVNDRVYEGTLEYVPGEYIRAVELPWRGLHEMSVIEIGINYFLARTEVLWEVPWDETIRPIGGEHGDWFFEMKLRGKKIVHLRGCNIYEIEGQPEWRHPDYLKYRWRAQQGHELFLKKRNIKRWIGFDEHP